MVQRIKNGSLLKINWLCRWDNMPRLGLTASVFLLANVILFLYNTTYLINMTIIPIPVLNVEETTELKLDLEREAMALEQCQKDYNIIKTILKSNNSYRLESPSSPPSSPAFEEPSPEEPSDMNMTIDLDYEERDDEGDGAWQEMKEDGTITMYQALFDDIENLPKSLPKAEKRNVVVLVNCLPILREIAADIRMMHRQVIRLINKRHDSLHLRVVFWGQGAQPAEEHFRDIHLTQQMPLIALQGAYKGYYDDAEAVIWIQHHLNFIDPNKVMKVVDRVRDSKKGTLLCTMGLLQGQTAGCLADAMAFSPETAKLIFMHSANHPAPMQVVKADYNNMNKGFVSSLSTYLIKYANFHKDYIGLASFNYPKYSKSYQIFTAHPTRRALPQYLKRNMPTPKKLVFNLLPTSCTEKGYVTLVKTSRSAFLRRNEIRMYYSKILGKQYPAMFNLYFLLGEGSETEESWMEGKVEEEFSKHSDIILYNFLDSYNNLPMKTFAGYQFFAEYCPEKQYVIFHDDDVYIKLHELRGQMNKLDYKQPHIKCLKGKCIPETPPNYMGKYFTWIDNYPPKYFIPMYSNGQCTGLTAAAAKRIYEVSRVTDYDAFRIEDMLYTGIMRVKANITAISGMHSVCEHFPNLPPNSGYFRHMSILYNAKKLNFKSKP